MNRNSREGRWGGKLGEQLSLLLGNHGRVCFDRGEWSIQTIEGGDRLGVFELLCEGSWSRLNNIVDLFGIDWLGLDEGSRFEVEGIFLSVDFSQRVRVKSKVNEGEEERETLTGLYPGADWYEREVFDMFGIYFQGHGDLRRILTDYGFVGHPLRKDFPVRGYQEVRYREGLKRVVSEDVELAQDYREVFHS